MKKILVTALALLMAFSLVGCALDNGMTKEPMTDDGAVKDNDGYIGNESTNDPAGDTVPENTMPETAIPETTQPGSISPHTATPNTESPDMMAPEQSPKP